MKVNLRRAPAMPGVIATHVEYDITAALRSITTEGDAFVVNDTQWYMSKADGRAKPCVMNSAEYLSTSFELKLKSSGWDRQKELGGDKAKKIAGQKIDAYREFHFVGRGFSLSKEKLLLLMGEVWSQFEREGSSPPFLEAYYGYTRRGLFPIPAWGTPYSSLFTEDATERALVVRVGVEFETGNIASSFRSLAKLNLLYWLGEIDVGVFITSDSKENGAARIWPPSNRNGSFQELESRNYRRSIQLPLWEFSFAPDGYSKEAKYLRRDRKLYLPRHTVRVWHDAAKGLAFDVCERDVVDARGKKRIQEILLPHYPAKAEALLGDEPALEADIDLFDE